MVEQCLEILEIGGINAVLLGYLYDGTAASALKIPPIDIFSQNSYKEYEPKQLTEDDLYRITKFNCFETTKDIGRREQMMMTSLFCFKSMFNHNKQMNIKMVYQRPNLLLIYAIHDITKGTELFIDYCFGIKHQPTRDNLLARYGIKEEIKG